MMIIHPKMRKINQKTVQTVQTVVGSDVFACDMEDVEHWDVMDIGLNIGHYLLGR